MYNNSMDLRTINFILIASAFQLCEYCFHGNTLYRNTSYAFMSFMRLMDHDQS